jgi:hypothetical protein
MHAGRLRFDDLVRGCLAISASSFVHSSSAWLPAQRTLGLTNADGPTTRAAKGGGPLAHALTQRFRVLLEQRGLAPSTGQPAERHPGVSAFTVSAPTALAHIYQERSNSEESGVIYGWEVSHVRSLSRGWPARSEGRAMDLDEAVTFALEPVDTLPKPAGVARALFARSRRRGGPVQSQGLSAPPTRPPPHWDASPVTLRWMACAAKPTRLRGSVHAQQTWRCVHPWPWLDWPIQVALAGVRACSRQRAN